MTTVVPVPSVGDVRIFLKSGSVVDTDVFEELFDYSYENSDGLVVHFGHVIKAGKHVWPVALVSKVVAKKVRVDEAVVWSPPSGVGGASLRRKGSIVEE